MNLPLGSSVQYVGGTAANLANGKQVSACVPAELGTGRPVEASGVNAGAEDARPVKLILRQAQSPGREQFSNSARLAPQLAQPVEPAPTRLGAGWFDAANQPRVPRRIGRSNALFHAPGDRDGVASAVV